MNRDEDPQLWDLLGGSKGPTPSPFFARNVVRAVRNPSEKKESLVVWFHLRRLVPVFSAAAAVVIAVFTFQVMHHHRQSPQNGFAAAEVQDAELVADLDILVNDDDADDTLLL